MLDAASALPLPSEATALLSFAVPLSLESLVKQERTGRRFAMVTSLAWATACGGGGGSDRGCRSAAAGRRPGGRRLPGRRRGGQLHRGSPRERRRDERPVLRRRGRPRADQHDPDRRRARLHGLRADRSRRGHRDGGQLRLLRLLHRGRGAGQRPASSWSPRPAPARSGWTCSGSRTACRSRSRPARSATASRWWPAWTSSRAATG